MTRGEVDTTGRPGRRATCGLLRRLSASLVAATLISAALVSSITGTASAAEGETAALPLGGAIRAPAPEIPAILSAADARLYRDIFDLQDSGNWAAADRRIRQLGDRLLMGHVLAQRYLHPTHYRSRFEELSAWLKLYADHPDAARIYGLAVKRKPANARMPAPPRDRFAVSSDNIEVAGGERPAFREARGEAAVRRVVSGLVRRERMSLAERHLARADVIRQIGRAGVDRTLALVAAGWFRQGETARAYTIASAAARRSGTRAPQAAWWAGLAAFRLERFDDAISHFDAMALAAGLSSRQQAAANFWAGRAALKGGQPERVGLYLDRAARFDRTFYGQIAARIRGAGPVYNWGSPAASARDVAAFAVHKAGRRTLALIQTGEEARAETELRTLRVGASAQLLRTVIALADAADMPGTALRAGRVLLRGTGERIDAALYPIPHWLPEGGFQIDRAVVYALARQESAFNTRAVSRSGARGLLQLMPATARYIAADRKSFRGRGRNELYDPGLNLALGQKYVDYLLTGDIVAGNMVLMIAAYNGGPGNIAKWQRKVRHGSDPLIFIESIPLRETRLFVTSVFENLWIYRARLGQGAPSLDALASGRWPTYVGQDGDRYGIAQERP